MSEDKPDFPNRIFDTAHFDKERKLSSAVNIDKTDDGGAWVTIIGNVRETKSGLTKITTKLGYGELAEWVMRLQSYLLSTA